MPQMAAAGVPVLIGDPTMRETQLAAGLPDIAPARLLDAGCGTGFAQDDLQARFPNAHSVALDLSPAMLDRVATPCCRVSGDLEHLPLADASPIADAHRIGIAKSDKGKRLGAVDFQHRNIGFQIGANQLGDGRHTSLMSRTTFQRAEAAYEELRRSAGLPLTYDVIYLYAQK